MQLWHLRACPNCHSSLKHCGDHRYSITKVWAAIADASAMCGREHWLRLISNLHLRISFWYSSDWYGLKRIANSAQLYSSIDSIQHSTFEFGIFISQSDIKQVSTTSQGRQGMSFKSVVSMSSISNMCFPCSISYMCFPCSIPSNVPPVLTVLQVSTVNSLTVWNAPRVNCV